jgi:hypothetical protein
MSLQKDTLVQSAMRLRQFGTTQSVTFFAPPEVDQSIVDIAGLNPYQRVTSAHIIHWLLHTTCEQLESLYPLFFSHGMDFCRRAQGALDQEGFLDDDNARDAYVGLLRQKERQSLVRLYAPSRSNGQAIESQDVTFSDARLKAFVKELKARRRVFHDTGDAVQPSALQEVEQEREVEVEVEVEKIREVQRPNWYQPHKCGSVLEQYIVNFISTGKLQSRHRAGYLHLFEYLKNTATGKRYGVAKPKGIESTLFLTSEFGKTVQVPYDRPDDMFAVRPASWTLGRMSLADTL